MLANMTERGSLVVTGPSNALVHRSNIYNPGKYTDGVVVGYPSMSDSIGYSKGVPAYFNTSINELPTINCIGNKVYVDHSKAVSGNGLSWDTAYASLNDLLNDPLIHYTTKAQRQVVHVLVRGDVDYPVHIGEFGHYTYFNNYLVIHNCTFHYETSHDVPIMYVYSTNRPSCIALGGVVFHSCTFILVQHNGKNATSAGEDGMRPEHKAHYIDNGVVTEKVYNYVCILGADYNYLYKCHLNITTGNGGNGGNAADDVDRSAGGSGGDSGQVHIGAEAYNSCTFELHYGNPGSGGNGADGMRSDGGASGGTVPIQFTSEKMYNCVINEVHTPICKGGDGGDGTDSSEYSYGGAGNGGDALLNFSLDYGVYVNKCTFNITIDLSNVHCGYGGKYTKSDDYGVHNHDAEGGSSSLGVQFSAIAVKNSNVNINVLHNGEGNRVNLAHIDVYIQQSHSNTIILNNTCEYTPYKNGFNNFELYNPIFELRIREASDTTVQITQGDIAPLPDGERLDTLISEGEVYGYNWSTGGEFIYNSAWFTMNTVRGYADNINPEHQFGLKIRLQKPGTVTCGYPSGGGGGNGYRVIGRNGVDNENVYARRGGDGSAAFTWMNWTCPAGEAGEGVRSASSGGLINFYENKDYNTDIVDVSFL